MPTTCVAELPHGVAAGDATANSVVLWAHSTLPGKVRFTLSTRRDFSGGRNFSARVTDPSVPVKVLVKRLKPDTRYFYRVVDKSRKAVRGEFRTLPVKDKRKGLVFGVTGDARPELAPYPGLRNIPDAKLAFLVYLGDCIYAENYVAALDGSVAAKTLADYRAKYAETFTAKVGLNTLPAARAATGQYAMIDDHEVVNDFAGAAPPASDPRFDQTGKFINETARYRDALQAFQENMPIVDEYYGDTGDPRDSRKRKLYRSRTFGKDAMFAMLDTRSFRDTELAPVTNPADPKQIGAFLTKSFDPTRTLLGRQQLADLKADLQAAQEAHVVWKFVLVPEPIQNLGVLGAADRYEGYAAERTELLKFIHTRGISNVVFVTADIHGTVVNNLTYEEVPGGPKTATSAFEISTGPIAFDAPFGPTVADLAFAYKLITPQQKAFYDSLPVANDTDNTINDKDDFIKSLIDTQLASMGYDPVGLSGSPINATLLQGDYFAGHTYGWTQFRIDGSSKKLTVTTYGVTAYNWDTLQKQPAKVTALTPQVVSQFEVTPK
ncbi:alkaline phosphatase D family protein [Candidatus Methylocalor cossyra]